MVVGVVCTGICNVVKHILAGEIVTLSNSEQTLGAESSFCVNVEALALRTALINWELTVKRKFRKEMGVIIRS